MTHEELIAALLKVEGNRPDSLGISTQWYRNPEGPQAAEALTTAQAEIEALRARVAELEAGLERAVLIMEVCREEGATPNDRAINPLRATLAGEQP